MLEQKLETIETHQGTQNSLISSTIRQMENLNDKSKKRDSVCIKKKKGIPSRNRSDRFKTIENSDSRIYTMSPSLQSEVTNKKQVKFVPSGGFRMMTKINNRRNISEAINMLSSKQMQNIDMSMTNKNRTKRSVIND